MLFCLGFYTLKAKTVRVKPTRYSLHAFCCFYSQLNSTKKCTKETNHSQELHSAQGSDDGFFPDVRDAVQRGSSQDKEVPYQLIFP